MKTKNTYTIETYYEYSGSHYRKSKHYKVMRNDGKCIAYDCPLKLAQMFVQATMGINNPENLMFKIGKKLYTKATMEARWAAQNFLREWREAEKID